MKKTGFLLFVMMVVTVIGFGQDIFKLVADGELVKVKALINKDKKLVHKQTATGKTPLHFAAEKGHLHILAFLLDTGASVDAGNVNNTTPLHYACFNNHLGCVKLLIARGAAVNRANKQSLTPLYFAVLKDNVEVARFLLNKGATVDCLDAQGGTPLHTAAQHGNLPLCQLLIKHGANPQKKDKFKRGTAFFAAQGGNKDILMTLANKGADIKKADLYGKTPLFNALVRGHKDAALWLLDQKLAVKNFKTRDGSTYLHAATESGIPELVKLMLDKGIKDHKQNLYGETPLSIAEKTKNEKMIALLNEYGIEESLTQQTVKGPYLGQRSPGGKPVIFAPGLVTTRNTTDRDICFTSDLKVLYFTQNWKIKEIKQEEKGWSAPQNVYPGKFLEAEGFLNPDEKKMYFLSRRPVGKSSVQGNWEIWTSIKSPQDWQKPKLLGEPFNGCFYTTFTRDYVMYYTGRGNDIYFSRFHKGEFAKPVKLSSSVNTSKEEYNCFIAPDESYLIFSSTGHADHYGGGDLYISFRNKKGSWKQAVNMGPTVNTSAHEYCPSVSPDGKYFFFSSTRLGNKDDVYWMDAKILKELKGKMK